jgi:hypothetical protein
MLAGKRPQMVTGPLLAAIAYVALETPKATAGLCAVLVVVGLIVAVRAARRHRGRA